MHAAPTWMSLLAISCVCGCASRGNIELLESQLRHQEQQLSQADDELSQLRTELSTARRQTEGLRQQLANQETRLTPEQLDLLYSATTLSINTLVTGGLDTHETPGDEELHLFVTPQGDKGEPIRTPGSMTVSLFDLDETQQPRRIGNWTFSAEQVAQHWSRGFAGSGYQFTLPWQTPPSGSTLLVRVRLTSIDGRSFDAAESITIQPPGGRGRSVSAEDIQQASALAEDSTEPPAAVNPFATLDRERQE